MGRASGQHAARAPALRRAEGMDMEAIFSNFAATAREPNWSTPNAFYELEANQFCRPAQVLPGEQQSAKVPEDWPGMDIDPALAVRLLKMDWDGNFHAYGRWLRPDRHLIVAPDKTCPGMLEAGQALADALAADEIIAVYCDYDVDGTAAGEILRRGLAPYCDRVSYLADEELSLPAAEAALLYGYADAQQGFGLTSDFVTKAHAAGARLLVTLDCGTGQVAQVKLAQQLGMKVIVVDHHNIGENPADFHLNPKLGWNGLGASQPELATSDNTGAQLAWKLAASVQKAKEGRTRAEHWQEALHLAGMGCNADMGSAVQHENRAFFWCAGEHPVPGVRALAAALDEDATRVGSAITTQAALNLPKRTSKVSAADIGALLACSSEEQARPYVEKLLSAYEEAKPVRKQMLAAALAQTGSAVRDEDGRVQRPVQRDEDDFFATAILGQEFADYAGYTGPVAQNVSRTAGKPAVIFALRGVDEHGQNVYKFSSRNDARVNMQLGGLIADEAMNAACTLKKRDESGEVIEAAVVGGHAEVVSGSCTEENIPRVIFAMQSYAKRRYKDTRSFWPTPWDGPEAVLSARKVKASRLEALEEQSAWLAPFTNQKQNLYPSSRPDRAGSTANNTELRVSVEGTLRDLQPKAGNEKWLEGILDLGGGVTRPVCYPADIGDSPVDKRCEWVLRLGKPAPYYLRTFHDPSAN